MPSGNHSNATTPRPRNGEPQPAPVTPGTLEHEGAHAKRDLASWWKNFKRGSQRRDEEKTDRAIEKTDTPAAGTYLSLPHESAETGPQGIFGVALQTSIRYANVAISLYDDEGKSYIYGYVPIVVAKCGVFLKEKATEVEGIFRLSGSEKRIKELRTQFNSPDRYGKGLDWSGYTVHDAANILRRYFNQLPEPIIPLEFYDRFREPLRNHQSKAVGLQEGQPHSEGDSDMGVVIRRYQQLITELPPLNRQLLLYILDLLAVFASKSDLNKMTTANLAAIFQPGILSHPQHDMAPSEYRLSQDVLIFLIENQDHFLIGMQGTAADPKTVQEVESGPPTPQGRPPGTKGSKTVGRSGSSASKYSGIVRRSASVSSKQSKASAGPTPMTPLHSPTTPGGGGVHRSNTLPSKKSPAIGTGRFHREYPSDPPTPGSTRQVHGAMPGSLPEDSDSQYVAAQYASRHPAPPEVISPSSSEGVTPLAQPPNVRGGLLGGEYNPPAADEADRQHLGPISIPAQGGTLVIPQGQETPKSATRGAFANLFSGNSPASDGRKPNKLQKKRSPGSANLSANSSQNSVAGAEVEGSQASVPVSSASIAPLLNAQAPGKEHFQPTEQGGPTGSAFGGPLQPLASPTGSFRSRSTATDPEQAIAATEATGMPPQNLRSAREMSFGEPSTEKEKKRRWFARKDKDTSDQDRTLSQSDVAPPHPPFASNELAQRSRSSVASGIEGSTRKSMNVDRTAGNNLSPESHTSHMSGPSSPPNDFTIAGQSGPEREGRNREKNPINWIKGKLAEHAEKREERDRLKEEARARSPDKEQRRGLSTSMQSLTAHIAGSSGRNRSSMDNAEDEMREAGKRSSELPQDQPAASHQQPPVASVFQPEPHEQIQSPPEPQPGSQTTETSRSTEHATAADIPLPAVSS